MQGKAPSTRPVKVLVISNYRNTTSARPEAEIFIGLAKRGFEIEIMTFGDAPYVKRFEEAGIKVIDFHPEKKFDSAAVAFIRDHLLEGKHDVLQLFNSKAYFNGIRAVKGLPVKLVMYRGTQANIHWYDLALYTKYFHPRVDKVICNSRSVEDEFNKQSLIDRKSKFVTINKGHNPDWYKDVVAADLSPYKKTADTFVITCVANARRVKGVKYLIEAMGHLQKGLDISLLLVGNGLDTEAFKNLANQTGYANQIFFAGFRKDALELVKASNAFAMPSIGAESLTKAVVEAMHLGTAPIITAIPGNKNMVEHGKTGFLIPIKSPAAFAEAIKALHDKPTWQKEIGENAQARIAEILDTNRTVKEYELFYTRLARGGEPFKTPLEAL